MVTKTELCLHLYVLTLLSLWSPTIVAAKPLSKRGLPVNGDGFIIPLTTDANGRYTVSVGMGNNNNQGKVQQFPFLLSTSSPFTSVAGDTCTACAASIGSSSLYNATLSQTETDLNKTQSYQMGSGGVSGGTIKENCGLLSKNGSYWWYPNQQVLVANQSSGMYGNGAAGVLGLGRSSGSASLIDTVFSNHQAWNNLTIGVAVNPQGASDAGAIDLRETDETLYTGEITLHQVANRTEDIPANYPADWSLHLDSWKVDTGASQFTSNTAGIAIVEPYFPEIRFPVEEAQKFWRDVPGATQLNDSATGLTWSVPCNPTVALTVTFSGQAFTVPASQLVTDAGGGNCIGTVMAWDNPFVESYMLGAAFAQTVYIVYNANRNGTGDTIGFGPRAGIQFVNQDKLSSGAVAGISVGATLAVVILLIGGFLWWRHKRAVRVGGGGGRASPKEQKGQHKIEPFTPTSSSTPMFPITTTNGGNRPYIIEQGPIGGEVGQNTALLSGTTPESSPQTASMSAAHRRKAEEAGLLAAGANNGRMQLANQSQRPQSSQTSTSGTDFLQQLVPQFPSAPSTPGMPEQHTHNVPPIPPIPTNDALTRHFSSAGTTAVSGSGDITRQASARELRQSQSTLGHGVLSPTSPQQIHYHIHLPPGATAPQLPPGSILHEHPDFHPDEPAPEYSERPSTPESSARNS